jgi:creatinine amidohydrolase
MTWPDFHQRDMSRCIAVLPVAAVEQHGPHLPLGTDAMIMQGYLDRVLARMPADLDALFLPLQRIGTSNEHIDFPGTLTFSPQTLTRMLVEIGESVARSGCRKLVIVNSHGGNSSVIDTATRELRRAQNMLAVAVSWARFGYPDGMFADSERIHGIHAGDIETSLMLEFRRDLVRDSLRANFVPATVSMEKDYSWLNAGRPAGFGWMAQDLSESGAMGNASIATAAKGESAADYGATAFIELLRDVEAFDLTALMPGPLSDR